MGKKVKELGTKRKRGKKFEFKGETSFELKARVSSKSIFRDKRLGERDPTLDKEQKYLMRYQKERDFISRRKQRFELDDTIELTHKGMRLEDMQDDYVEDYDLDLSDDEPHTRKLPRMDDDLVLEHHFGEGSAGGHGRTTGKSRRDAFEELILKSKQNKMVRQQEKEENFEETRRLDEDFSDITSRLQFKTRDREREAQGLDEYDNLLMEIRDETKVQAEIGKDDYLKRQIRKQFEENGEDWRMPVTYKEFVVKIRGGLIESLNNIKTWTDCDTKKEKQLSQDRLLEFTLKFLLNEIDDNAFQCLQEYSFLTEYIYILSKSSPVFAEKVYVSTAVSLGKSLTLGVAFFYHLVSLLFPITFEDSFTATLALLAQCYFIEYPLASCKCTRNLLFFMKIYAEQWLVDKFSPDLTRCLQRVLTKYNCEQKLEEFTLEMLFLNETPVVIHTYALEILKTQRKIFGKFMSFRDIWKDFIAIEEEEVANETAPMQLHHRPIEEIPTYEPLVYGKVKSSKKNKDLNKEVTELDKLREQTKRAKKLSKKALERETEIVHHEKGTEYKLIQEKKESQQNYVKNMLDELQVEFKKFDTSLERRTDKKKRKTRMAGGKTERNT